MSDLLGAETSGGWKVVQKIEFPPDHTGGYFSQCYFVEKNGTRAFLKLIDITRFKTFDELQRGLTEFSYETELAKFSAEKKLSRIVRLIESGEIQVDPANPVELLRSLPYLIFELGEGDIRPTVDVSKQVSNAWRFSVLHKASAALLQLHQAQIAHQDLKPSNVVRINGEEIKLADLGRSSRKGAAAPHDVYSTAGALKYAPFEQKYSHLLPDWIQRRVATDVFHVGCLTVFVFTNIVLPGFVFDELEGPYRPDAWGDPYPQVIPHIRAALARCVDKISPDLPPDFRDDIAKLILDMCDPDPVRRGSGPGPRSDAGTSLWLQRFVSKFDMLRKKAAIRKV